MTDQPQESELIDSDFAMLNFRLAKHYGVPGVSHADIKPVNVKYTTIMITSISNEFYL